MTPFRCIAADPPWRFRDRLPGPKRGAASHYGVMSTRDLCALALPPIAPDAILFLWRVASMPLDALDVCRAWGFTPKSEIVWIKTTGGSAPALGSARLAFGMGHTVRAAHETCIIATRGKLAGLVTSHSERSVFFAPRGRHSAKPDAFYELVERLCVGPRLELFARRSRPGWTTIGNEAPEPMTLNVTH